MSSRNKDTSKSSKNKDLAYRFIIRNNEDLKEINSFVISRSRIYFLLSGIVLLLWAFLICLIVFTPVKRLIPGYGDINNNRVFVNLNNEINELEKAIEEQITYTESLKKVIFNSDIKAPSIHKHSHGDEKVNITPSTTTMESRHINTSHIPYLYAPVKGQASMGYLLKKDHFGIDIVCEKNAEVKSIAAGVILNKVWDPSTGNTISIQHSNNLVSIYKHNATLLKNIGDHVSPGEAIAIVGNSGEQSSGPHLHFELWLEGQPVNPELHINFD